MLLGMPVKPLVILMAEDSEHDIRAVRRVWEKHGIHNPLMIVTDGAECMEYLMGQGRYADRRTYPQAGVLLLDINLPKLDGFEILRRVKETPILKRMPVIMLTTSTREEDKVHSYDLGANAYLTKPVGMENLAKALTAFNVFWELVELPEAPGDGKH